MNRTEVILQGNKVLITFKCFNSFYYKRPENQLRSNSFSFFFKELLYLDDFNEQIEYCYSPSYQHIKALKKMFRMNE